MKLVDVLPDLAELLNQAILPGPHSTEKIERLTATVVMRDGVNLATDLYLPSEGPSPTIAMRTPYGRQDPRFVEVFLKFVECGYAVVAQDCRGTGDSEPDTWDYYVYEREDSYDFIEWLSAQSFCNGFIAGCGSSYLAQTQWCMALHPRMTTIVPEVGGLGIAFHTAHLYMFLNAYSQSVGKGDEKLLIPFDELERQMLPATLAGGYFNEPLYMPLAEQLLRRFPHLGAMKHRERETFLWNYYCSSRPADRARLIKEGLGVDHVTIGAVEGASSLFGQAVAHDAHMFAFADASDLCRSLKAPALMITGWYDWGLNDALASWHVISREASEEVRAGSRLLITPSAHNTPGYHEGKKEHPELEKNFRTTSNVSLLLRWYASVQRADLQNWPLVIYYLMGANEWHIATAWPPPETRRVTLYLADRGALEISPPEHVEARDVYTYDSDHPTPTVGGSVVSYTISPGSVDASQVQQRSDVVTYTTSPLHRSVDVIGPMRLVLYVSTTAPDTDFTARLTDVFPDGRAIQLQSGMLRARHRSPEKGPELLDPGQIYALEIDMWATANRFSSDHRIRLDISSSDFPRFDRNSNLGGEPGLPRVATQTIYHGQRHPSRLIVSIPARQSI